MVGEKVPCKFCKNQYSPFNVEKHEKGCAMNPANSGTSSANQIEADPEPSGVSATKIRNVMILPNSGLAAHITREGADPTIVPIDFLGTMIIGEEELPTLLVVDGYGLLIPPSTIPGFMGIYKYEPDQVTIPAMDPTEDPEPEPEPEKEKLTMDNTTDQILGRIKEVKSVP